VPIGRSNLISWAYGIAAGGKRPNILLPGEGGFSVTELGLSLIHGHTMKGGIFHKWSITGGR